MDSSRHFEKDSEVFQSLRAIAQKLDELGVPYAVAGAMAMFEHGVRRFTEDVDILISTEGLRKVHKKLVGLGYRPKFAGAKNLRDATTGVSIEFILEGHFPGDGKPKPVSFPSPASVAVEIDGIKFLNLETLVELKLASGLSSTDRAKDLVDVQEIIRSLQLDAAFGSKLHPSVQDKYLDLWRIVFGADKRYVTLWRNKWLTADAASIDDMVIALRAAADQLAEMLADGVQLDTESSTSDDYAYLYTTNPAVARKYDMHEEEEFWGEDEELDDRPKGA
jgi:hypothetical protein